MPREIMERRASDNVYLHKDFHGALSTGIEYLQTRFGEEAVRDYLRQFTSAYYAPLKKRLCEQGLSALKDYFENMYAAESGEITTTLTDTELVVSVSSCPAVMHMRGHGYTVARLFRETTETVNSALCDGTPYAAELVEYDEDTGKSVQRFSWREP